MFKIKKLLVYFFSFLLVQAPTLVLAQTVDPLFNPNKLIEDGVFVDTKTFGGPEGIQKFLENKKSVLANTDPAFLVMLKEPTATILKEGLEDPRPNLGRLRTAAELIWDASLQSGLNPQVILVTLQKEQGLITNHSNVPPEKLQKILNAALGFACPDSGGCGDVLPGFYFQLFGNFDSQGNRYLGAARSLVKSYSSPNGRGPLYNGRAAQVGETVIIENTTGEPYNAQPSQSVTLSNKATAALYRYTPHVFNGNYNFWKYFQEWFKYPNGTLLSLASDSKIYIIQNGLKQLVPDFVVKARTLDLSKKIIVSPTELSAYSDSKVYGPADNTIVKIDQDPKQYVFLNNIKYPASEFVLKQRGLLNSLALSISAAEGSLFETGAVLPPSEGTIIRGNIGQAVYLVEGSTLKLFSSFTFKQRKVKTSQVVLVPDDELNTYLKQGFVAPLDGTLVKSEKNQTVYLIENGFKHPFSSEIFKNRGLSYKNIAVLADEEVSSIPIGSFAVPKDVTWLADAKTGQMYLFKEGSLHKISSYVAKTRKITPDYFFSPGEIAEWPEGIAYPPKNGALVSGDKEKTVYLVEKGQLRALTAAAFKNRRLSFKNVANLPQAEVDAYAKGDVITK